MDLASVLSMTMSICLDDRQVDSLVEIICENTRVHVYILIVYQQNEGGLRMSRRYKDLRDERVGDDLDDGCCLGAVETSGDCKWM